MIRDWFGGRKQLFELQGQARVTARKMLKELLDRDDEEGFVACARLLKPNITKEELQRALKLFREYAAVRRAP